MDEDSVIAELYGLTILLGQAELALYKARSKELRKFGITPIQSIVFVCVHNLGARATLTNIAHMQFRELNTTSDILKRMVARGLLRRQNSTAQKGSTVFALTDLGRQLFDQAMQRNSLRQILSQLSAAKRKQLASSLTIVRDSALDYLETQRRPGSPISYDGGNR